MGRSKTELFESWKRNVFVAGGNMDQVREQFHSPHDMTAQTGARGWLSYRELYNSGDAVIVGHRGETAQAHSFYTDAFNEKVGLWQMIRHPNRDMISHWAAENPHNLLLLTRSGADIELVSADGQNVRRPSHDNIHLALAEKRGIDVSDIDQFSEESEEIFYRLFHHQEEIQAMRTLHNTADARAEQILGMDGI